LSIACEISITTTIDHEVGNVVKCLKAGFMIVAAICVDEERLRKIETAVAGTLGPDGAGRVIYSLPDPFIDRLKTLHPVQNTPQAANLVKGWSVTRSTPKLTPEEQKHRQAIITQALAKALKRG